MKRQLFFRVWYIIALKNSTSACSGILFPSHNNQVATISPAREACLLFLNLKCNLVSRVIYLVKLKITARLAAAFFRSSYSRATNLRSLKNLLTYFWNNKIFNHCILPNSSFLLRRFIHIKVWERILFVITLHNNFLAAAYGVKRRFDHA